MIFFYIGDDLHKPKMGKVFFHGFDVRKVLFAIIAVGNITFDELLVLSLHVLEKN